MRRVMKYSDGGKVIKPKGPAKPAPDTVQTPKPASTADAMRNTRNRQMKALGLKDGGPVRDVGPKIVLPAPEKGPKPKRITGVPKPKR